MKKLLLILCCTLSAGVYAAETECDNPSNSFEAQKCLSVDVKKYKNELNTVYKKLYSQTDAKTELDAAQKAWLKYNDLQCGKFVAEYTGHSPATVVMDLDCQSTLLQQRISYLQTLLSE
ncbi:MULTISPECIES: lysozyme inhibitor LprI family protein [unclassified Acinetobacter]|uniref:lysozyme inhibitor LprI family protein n=1 Tax=unclassified Acinetobacter TaxID=196816 RepID=UPI002446D6F4|nr:MULTISPECIES: lysozyme inhibitor LprI family protein [unclassified Acinetobacter]MDH0030313.1 lysozyme inhibitor LprI family protein [Acinetobacter sp. GD04021]MDH0885881.1 lysozyme inhibitor LprI family protein [Acinetobacter sp. GD03873]MDH1082501.1 lysozyme inhibitor LprI family protein [Acinetobacter sp. GD03983]MDH2189107.1 lysozyme inhibitor LprI family protein [Acinetobacter sp. GD03645]MDH2202295.1 lysozyme inhibitor LprI family protein [Acinetobacter sp. GD03647]